MFARKISRLVGLLLALAAVSLTFTQAVRAQGAPTPTPLPAAGLADYQEDPRSYQILEEEYQAYYDAISRCETPSLECLVRHVSRFTAIEWVQDMIGLGAQKTFTTADGGASQNAVAATSIGGLTNLISAMYSHPVASSGTYVADVLNSAKLAPPAYAQGLGFASLDPVIEIWKLTRNVAYLFFVILIVVVGFMIMLRQKIGAQTAVTAQQAIPNIIISLILVTFSYAIVGLLIDLMYVVMFLIVGLFSGILSGTDGSNLIDMNIFQLGGFLLNRVTDFSANIDAVTQVVSRAIGDNLGTDIIGFVGGLTLTIVLVVAVAINLFRLFFELLKSYAAVIIGTITAPIELMFGAIPGQNPFPKWLKNMIANLMAFPVVLLIVVLFMHFKTYFPTGEAENGGFMPPYLIGRGQGGAMGSLLGFALLLAMPKIVADLKKRLGASDGFGSMVVGAAGESLQRGWQGGQLIEGAGWSDTRNIPFINRFGSGQRFAQTLWRGTQQSRDAAADNEGWGGWRGRLNTLGLGRGLAGEVGFRVRNIYRGRLAASESHAPERETGGSRSTGRRSADAGRAEAIDDTAI